ncbi:hypothetical protein [Burkholderia ubonensis]|uniref:hypothetical protein n=1 Tax=Burkholderia ubonensis TaxID=101571 RepID=UPI000AB9067B|nr:hypothetical protein [Burkholderia ubonensis]
MKTHLYLKNYGTYLRRAAVGIPRAPVSDDVWDGFIDAVREVGGTLLAFALSLVILATYPVSVFVLALIACEIDRNAVRRHKKRMREIIEGEIDALGGNGHLTVKPRAKYLVGPGGLAWEVSHPHIKTVVWTDLPHDAAVLLLERHVLHHQCERRPAGVAK